MSMINFNELNVDHVEITPPQPKSYTADNGTTGSYFSSDISYRYGGTKKDKFRLEMCEVTCSSIYKSGDNKDKKKEEGQQNQQQTQTQQGQQDQNTQEKKKYDKYYVKITFDHKNPQSMACAKKVDELHVQFAKLFSPHKGKWKHFSLTDSSSNDADNNGFKSLLRYTKDEMSGERYENSDPMQYYNLVYGRDDKGNVYKTKFYDLGKKDEEGNWIRKPGPIEWEILQKSVMKGIPVVHYRSSYGNDGKLSIQSKLYSFVVTEIKEREYNIMQSSTIDRLLANSPDLSKSLDDQIAAMTGLISAEIPASLTDESTDESPPSNASYNPDTDTSPGLDDTDSDSNQTQTQTTTQVQTQATAQTQTTNQSTQVNLPGNSESLRDFMSNQTVSSSAPGSVPGSVPGSGTTQATTNPLPTNNVPQTMPQQMTIPQNPMPQQIPTQSIPSQQPGLQAFVPPNLSNVQMPNLP